MGNIAKYRKRKIALLTAAVVASAWMPTAWAMPQGPNNVQNLEIPKNEDNTLKVVDGELNIRVNGARGAVDWEKFNIASGETVRFDGVGKWMVLNRVSDGPRSEIFGNLFGQGGTVFLVNPNGILFGEKSQVDVGSLVASTMDIKQDDFMDMQKNSFVFNETGKNTAVTISKGADITARDGYVAIFAHDINNAGKLTAPEVAMAAGKSVELSYDDKINLVVNVSNDDKDAIVDTKNNYVLMTAEDASNIIGNSVINNSGTITAKGITKDDAGNLVLSGDGGNIVMTAAKVLVNGKLSADAQEGGSNGGTITTAGYESLQVRDGAEIHAKSDAEAEAGTWNINAKNLVITANKDATGDSAKPNKVSNAALGNALGTTNVDVVASPKKHDYYSDIVVEQAITKDGENATSLSLTAGRNVSVDANIKSDKGALNLTLNSNNTEKTNSARADGASIIRADISTKGGSFTTTGEHGTYIGIKRDSKGGEKVGTPRSISTEGGDITLGGDEVLVATGGTVTLDAGNQGNVTIVGDVNSANAYYDGGNGIISWEDARKNAKASGTGDLAGKTHLAVITGELEDAVATSAIAKDRNKDTEAYVGGHVVKVMVDSENYPIYQAEDGTWKRIQYTEDEKGNPVIIGVPVIDDSCLDAEGNVTKVMTAADETNKGKNAKGWYKIEDANDSSKVRYAHFWAWTEGTEQERGKIFFVQTKGENILNKEMEGSTDADWSKEHGFAVTNASSNEPYYKNFAPNEPNDDKGQDGTGTQLALAINYDTHKNDMRSEILYSQWDDIGESQNKIAHYVVEADLGETALVAKGKNVEIDGAVGNLTPLKSVTVDASKDVAFKKSVHVINDVDVLAKGNVGVNAIEAGNTISLAGNDVTLAGTLSAGATGNEEAVKVVAQKKFINKAGADVMQLGEGSRWKVYSETPYADEFGGLNSGSFAEWGWKPETTEENVVNTSMARMRRAFTSNNLLGATEADAASDAASGLYIFKYNPTLTFHVADGGQKELGTQMEPVGYTVKNELEGQFTGAFRDGKGGTYAENAVLMTDAVKANLSQIKTVSDGYAAGAGAGRYEITLAYGADNAPLTEKTQIAAGYKNALDFNAVVMVAKPMPVIPDPTPVTPDPTPVTPTPNPSIPTPNPNPPTPNPGVTPENPTGPVVPTITDNTAVPTNAPEDTQTNTLLNPGEKPQLDALTTSNLAGTASITQGQNAQGPSIDRVLGLQGAELPFFNEKLGQVKLYGTYDVTVDPDSVKMEPTAKVLPEPDQPKNQYREYDKELTTADGSGMFRLTYNGSTLDIYPVDKAAKALLKAGDGAKNVEVESQALLAAFKSMGITLDDLDGVYTHFEEKR